MTYKTRFIYPLLSIFSVIFLTLLLAYGGLLGTSTWRPDEYDILARYRTEGISFLWHRVMFWSPRPFSELLIYFYATLVNSSHLQLIPLIMSLVWSGLVFSIGLSVYLLRNTGVSFGIRMLPILLPVVLTLCIAKTGEVFYWPFGSMAYMPTISAILAMLAILIWGNAREHGLLWGISGLILAASSEMGTFFIVFLSGLLALSGIGRDKTTGYFKFERDWLKPLIPSILVAICVLALLYIGRLGNPDEAKMGPGVSHNVGAVLMAAIPEALRQILGKAEATGWLGGIPYLLIKLCLGLFVFSLMRLLPTAHLKLHAVLAFALASIATIGLSEIAAFYQFGVSCCERHDTIRHFLSYVAVIAFSVAAAFFTKKIPATRNMTRLSIATGLLLMVLCTGVSVKKLWADYRTYDNVTELHNRNWLFGQSPPFTFTIEYLDGHSYGLLPMPPEGIYALKDQNISIFSNSILRFFGAEEIIFQQKRDLTASFTAGQIKNAFTQSSDWREMTCATDIAQAKNNTMGTGKTASTQLTVGGWMNLPDTGLNLSQTKIMLRVSRAEPDADVFFPLELSDRPDVAQHFKRDELLRSGYTTTVNLPFTRIRGLSITATDGALSARCSLRQP